MLCSREWADAWGGVGQALWDARQCQILAEKQFERNYERSAAPSYLKGFVRKGFAYMGLRRWRSAKAAFEEGIM